MTAALSLQHLSKTYANGIHAVDDLSLEVAEGELLVLMGPSGCGKTTTLRMIAGLERPSGGSIAIAGRSVDGMPPRHRDIALVFQQGALYPHLSVYGNLSFGLKLRHVGKAEIERRITEAAAALGIEDLLERKPGELSGGQQQRVALGRAMVRQPRLFLFDEPLSHLDAGMRSQLRQEIRRLHERLGTAMIYVTHDQTEAMALGQRIAVLYDGRLQQVGCPQTLYDRPCNRCVAGMVGSPAMNFFSGRIERGDRLSFVLGHDDVLAGDLVVRLPETLRETLAECDGQPITLGIRPEHLSLTVGASTAPPGCVTMPAVVEAVERLGAEQHVYLRAGRQTFLSRMRGDVADGSAGPSVGRQVTAVASRLYFFDASEASMA